MPASDIKSLIAIVPPIQIEIAVLESAIAHIAEPAPFQALQLIMHIKWLQASINDGSATFIPDSAFI